MHDEPPKGFIEELQSLSEVAKTRVLIVSTIVIMLVVVIVWFSYFNGILANTGQSAVIANGGPAQATSTTPPANSSSIWQNIKDEITSIGNIFKGSSNYTIQPSK